MTSKIVDGCKGKEDDGGGGPTSTRGQDRCLTNDQYQETSAMLNRCNREDEQAVDIFIKHLDQQQQQQHLNQDPQRERRSSLPTDAIELTTLSGVVRRRKQQLQLRYQQQQSANVVANNNQQLLMPVAPKTARPLSISSISSAVSSGSSSSANSSSSSGIQSSLTRNGSLNYGHEFRKNAYLASIESLNSSNNSESLENAFKNLNLSTNGQLKDTAATRAAVLAAGESQRRGFSTPGNKISRINRSLHASLRYDKNTAYRIHQMAQARALFHNNDQPSGHTDSTSVVDRRGTTLSRHDSSTSSDSGHPSQSSRHISFKCTCKCNQTITSSLSASQVDTATGDNDAAPNKQATDQKLFCDKAATIDGSSCQRGLQGTTSTTTTIIKHLPNCSLANPRPRRASAKLQPSPSSASSHSNTSSLFRDDGFEDDLTSTTSDQAPIFQRHHRFSFQGQIHHRHLYNFDPLRRHGEEDDEYQSCEEEFANSHTTSASTTSNLDDCALSTTSSSIIHHEVPILDKISLANVKQQYRRSLLLEHQQQQHLLHSQHINQQNKIQALIQSPPKLCHLMTPSGAGSSSAANTSTTSSSVSANSPTKSARCDDRTVNIIGHMPTRSPGYWDSNLSITQRVVTEIIETERTYVDDLEQIVTGYICYLRNVLKQQKQQSLTNSLMVNSSNRVVNDDADKMMGTRTTNEEDDVKSMSVFDDETTGQANDDVYDDDVDEVDHDESTTTTTTSAKENIHNNNNNRGTTASSPSSATNNNNCRQQGPLGSSMGQSDIIVSAIDIKKLFSNLEDIYKFNKDLLFRLEECYLNPSSVAECFVENASGFEVYTHYCTMYPQVVSTLTELMADPATAQMLKERQSELNQSLPLGSYLLKPVQRILKYHILFQSLIKHTADDETVSEKDRQLINEAFSVMTSIASHINAMKKRHEHSIRVQEVQGLLCGWEGPDLTTLGELILEDTFRLYNRQKSTRHLFLFDNVLLITKKKRDGSLCYKGHIECSNLMLIENIEGQPLVFNTVPFDNPKALCSFQAKNLDKKRDWCLQMKEVIIKSYEVNIPVHVRDILMSLTNTSSSGATETPPKGSKGSMSDKASRVMRAPNYLEKKRAKNEKKQKS